MLQALIVTLREGVEAALIVGITLAYLTKIGRLDLRKTVYAGLIAAFVGSVAGALVLSLLARERVSVSELVARAPQYTIVKAKVARGPDLGPVYAGLRRRFPDASVDTQDGLRLSWPDRWLHVRPSGTEPIIRLIAEAPSRADAEQLIEEGRRLCAAS